jgi:tetratricopeptide (TPR) repeat protein
MPSRSPFRCPRSLRAALTLLLALPSALLMGACADANVPLTQDYRDEAEDRIARRGYYEDAAITYLDGGRYNESIEMWNKVLKDDPNNAKAKWGLARAYIGRGGVSDLKEAIALLEEIKDLNWTDPVHGDRKFGVYRDLGNAYSELGEKYDNDARRGVKILETNPNADVSRIEGQIAQQRGRRNENLAKAIPIYRQMLSMKENSPYALAGLARAHLSMGNDDLGLMWANKYILQTKGSQKFWRNKMADYEDVAGKNMTDEQRDFFLDKLEGGREKEKTMHLMVGSVYMRRSQYDMAAQAFTRVTEIDPDMPAPYVERAQAYANARQYNLAVRDLEHYLKITDPVEHRDGRVNAAQLLDRYQRITGGQGFLGNAEGSGASSTTPGGFMR